MESKHTDSGEKFRSSKFSKDEDDDYVPISRTRVPAEAKSLEQKVVAIGSKSISREEKARVAEQELDEEVDDEFEALKRTPNVGSSLISMDPIAQRIAAGFRINSMNMKDGNTGKLVWESSRWGPDMFQRELEGDTEDVYSNIMIRILILSLSIFKKITYRIYSEANIAMPRCISRN